MPNLVLFDEVTENEIHTIILEEPPYNGDVEVDVVPKTRKLVMDCQRAAKRNRIFNRHQDWNEEKTKKVSVEGKPDEAFVQELADALIKDWRGVVDRQGNVVECTRENKIRMFNNVEVANFLINEASQLGSLKDGADNDNIKK